MRTPLFAPLFWAHRRLRAHQLGVTLIELMVGMALGLFILAALLSLFVDASAQSQNLARSGTQIENGRYVSELLRDDLRMAGFFGETSLAGVSYSLPDPCATVPTGWSAAPFTVPAPIQGYGPSDTLTCLTDRKAGTAAVAVRRLEVGQVSPASLTGMNTQYHVQYSYCTQDAAASRLVFAADPTLFVLRNRACTTTNSVRAYVSRVYYVATCNRCGVGGDTIPTLKRVDLVGDRLILTPIADGIDDLRFEYGFDLDNNGSADQYQTGLSPTGAASSWANVMTLKAHFITRSVDKATGGGLATAQTFTLGGVGEVNTASDGYTRRAYSSVFQIVNPSGAREVQ